MAAVPIAPSRHLIRWRVAFALAMIFQLVVLYKPKAPGSGTLFPHQDKVVHLVIFGLVAWTAIRAGLPLIPVIGLLLAHAVVSELIQHYALPNRDGNAFDSVADALGTLLGAWLAARSTSRRRPVAG